MNKGIIIVLLLCSTIIISGCSQIEGTKIMNFFNYKNILDFATNCSVNFNISLNQSYCNGSMKRPVYYSYDSINKTWDNLCCTFDSRCLAKTNANVSNICSNFNANFTYISPVYDDAGTGSMCCNGAGICFVDHMPNSQCTYGINATADAITIAFNLSGTSEWNAICCVSGGY